MKHKITIDNIEQYIEGNSKMFLNKLGFASKHLQEQVSYRMLQCKNDCMITKHCKYCGCDVPGKMYVSKSCNNGERFPDLMSKVDWELFKKDKNIE